MPRAKKRVRLESETEPVDFQSSVLPELDSKDTGFTINAEYAKRFEHNKRREEIQRLEEKYGKSASLRKRDEDEDEEEDDESSSEDEDDEAELATADVDAEITDLLQAIRNKDPRVYDQKTTFYKPFEPDAQPVKKEDKPMYLTDYHRENLLAGHDGGDVEAMDAPPITYQQEQDAMRKSLVGSMHAAAAVEDAGEGADDDEDGFLVKAAKPRHLAKELDDQHKASTKSDKRQRKHITDEDVAGADKDPEKYLSNFMAARAWLPSDGARQFTAMDSDDSEDDQRADEYENAFNMRFEDPKMANEKLQTFSRDVGKYGVRREEKSARQKARDREREQKEAEKLERREEKARLRKLKIDEIDAKVNKIKEAAGLTGQDVDLTQWRDIIDGDFDDDQWDKEMQERFGDKYYADGGAKAKKPKWDDDIDIGDLVPDFDEDDAKIELSDGEDDDAGGVRVPREDIEMLEDGEDDDQGSRKKKVTKKDRERAKTDAKKVARKQRSQIESMIDDSLALASSSLTNGKGPAIGFRYRETSPTSFGLSTRDILFADDKQLNEFAGLKKLATFRDDEKKRRDKKRLNKKARLRQWRKETFGNVDGPQDTRIEADDVVADDNGDADGAEHKKKKRRRNKKGKTEEAASVDV